MNTLLWIIQRIVAIAFIMAGFMKTTQPKENLLKNMPWVNDYSTQTVNLIVLNI